jgi:hypothetical protein
MGGGFGWRARLVKVPPFSSHYRSLMEEGMAVKGKRAVVSYRSYMVDQNINKQRKVSL